MTPSRATLLFSCLDRRGIVAEIAAFINAGGGNIVNSSQHNDPESNTFFMRVEWDIDPELMAHHQIEEHFAPIASRLDLDSKLYFSHQTTRIALFVSKALHCLYDLLLRHREGDLAADVAMVVSNHRAAQEVADWFGVPFFHFPIDAASKAIVEERQIALLQREGIDLVVLARYMQILTERFVDAFPNRIINIHHSFLPAFVGARPYHQAFERGVKIIGATSHYASADLDQGPIIDQDVIHISHRDQVADIVRKGSNLERVVLARAVRLHLEHRVQVFRNKTILFN